MPNFLDDAKESIKMLVAAVLKKLLWTLRYPSFAPESGPYRVGAIQSRIPGTIQCQIHFPAAGSKDNEKPPFYPYFRPSAVQGLADYSRSSSDLLDFLSNRNHPCLINAEPLLEGEKKFPLVIFSHGLGGCMEMYTQFCQQIASYGYCVVAMEHEDGSGAYAETKQGNPIYYKRPDNSPYSRSKVINFRRAFLTQRVEETTRVLEYILQNQPSNGNDDKESNTDSDRLKQILKSIDTSNGVALMGHSFGGATMVLAAQKYLSEDSDKKKIQPRSLSVLDPWAFSLEDDALNQGVDGIPVLSILSESWLTNPETAQVDQLLQKCPTLVSSLYAPNSVHASFADSVGWLPGFITRRMGLRGAKEKKFETFEATAKVCVEQIETGKVNNIGSLKEYKFENTKQEQPKKAVAVS